MASPEWHRVKEILSAALELAEADRAAYLDHACGPDTALRAEVVSLLAHDAGAGDFLSKSALEESFSGMRIGPYRILGEIGHGGMGRVFRAARADDEFDQQVALKLIKRGMDSSSILRQFRNERQILASLDHPNIARLFDGGVTDDGQPYFVMELIEGSPLHDYCREHKPSLRAKLALFRQICSAVHYAHQRLIVHRDLKPSNVLVGAGGVPKLLDFGIARILTEQDGEATATIDRRLTPAYASPEHLRGQPVTTASDVYSLGVVFYELLTDARPYDTKSSTAEEILQFIQEKDLPAPSTMVEDRVLRREIRGDLDNIALKALRKDPESRYGSVEQFSEDVRRFLEGLPVIARKDSFSYRARKFIGRHRAAAAAAALAAISLTAGAGIALWQARVAREERRIAERRFNDVRALANTLLFDVYDKVRNLPGATPAQEVIVKSSLKYLDDLARESSADSSLAREIASGYMRLGELQGAPREANLGDAAGALRSFHKARELLEHVTAADPSNTDAKSELAAAYGAIQDSLSAAADPAARAYMRKHVDLMQSVANARPDDRKLQRGLAVAYFRIAREQAEVSDWATAESYYRQALALFERLGNVQSTEGDPRYNIGLARERLAAILSEQKRYAEALELTRSALNVTEALAREKPNEARHQILLATIYQDMADLSAQSGNSTGADELYRKGIAIRERISRADPRDQRAGGALARGYVALGQFLWNRGKHAEALDFLRRGLRIREGNADASVSNLGAMEALTDYTQFVTSRLEELRRCGEAAAIRDRSIRRLRSAKGSGEMAKLVENLAGKLAASSRACR